MPVSRWTPGSSPGANDVAAGPMAHTDLRVANTALILRRLQVDGGSTRAGLVRSTGLSKATVSTLVASLVAAGLIKEDLPARNGAVGRPGTAVSIAPGAITGVGVEIGPARITLSSVDATGSVLRHDAVEVEDRGLSPERVLGQAGTLLAEETRRLRAEGTRAVGTAVAQPGVLDYATSSLVYSSVMGWRDVPVLSLIERGAATAGGSDLGVLALDNDAKLGAVATYDVLKGEGVEDLLYLSGGTGIGAGIIADGRLLRGWRGYTGEIGHMLVEPGGLPCHCGRSGCLETRVGLDAVTSAAPAGHPSRDQTLSVEERTDALHALIDEGDAAVTAALDRGREALTQGLAILVDVLNPEAIVLSGYLAAFADRLVGPVTAVLDERSLDTRSRPRVLVSTLGRFAPSHGAAILALDRLLEDPTVL